jgi:deazaflavin-dependent oxidoreductase (nitroreductase family)
VSDYNSQIIDEFRANEGRVGGMWEGTPLVLLHHTGAKSGRHRVTPVAYLSDGGRYVVIASNGGAPTSPDWYHNLKAHPNFTIEVGTATIDVAASAATGDGRTSFDRLRLGTRPAVSTCQAVFSAALLAGACGRRQSVVVPPFPEPSLHER